MFGMLCTDPPICPLGPLNTAVSLCELSISAGAATGKSTGGRGTQGRRVSVEQTTRRLPAAAAAMLLADEEVPCY